MSHWIGQLRASRLMGALFGVSTVGMKVVGEVVVVDWVTGGVGCGIVIAVANWFGSWRQ